MEKVQIIPPPKDVDPRVLAWKGAAVLGKMDGVSELWITAQDWVRVHFHCIRNDHAHVVALGYSRYACFEGEMLLSLRCMAGAHTITGYISL